MAAEKLRDLSQPIDVGLLDATVAAFYGTGSKDEVRPSLLLCTLCTCIALVNVFVPFFLSFFLVVGCCSA